MLLALIEAAHLSAFALLLSLGLPFAVCKLVSIPISMLFFFSMVNMERGKVAFVYAFAMAYALMVCGVAGNLGAAPVSQRAGREWLAVRPADAGGFRTHGSPHAALRQKNRGDGV